MYDYTHFTYCTCKIKLHLNFPLGPILYTTKYALASLFIGLALSKNLNADLFCKIILFYYMILLDYYFILYYFCKIKLKLNFLLGPILYITNYALTSLLTGLALSKSLNVVLLYIYNMQNAYNPTPSDE
jgi:hypothetical protein